MVEKDCTNCVYVFGFIPAGHIQRHYMCKRFPPAPYSVGNDPVRGPAISASQPIVHAGQWCHEFQPAESAHSNGKILV